MFKISKRILISIILTVITCVLTAGYWLISERLSFQFNIKTDQKNPISISTKLNRKDNPNFKNSFQEQADVHFKNQKGEYFVSFKQKTPPKRLKIEINNLIANKIYKVSDISFSKNRYPVSDLSKFETKDAILKIENKDLIIIPKKENITLTYTDKINARRPLDFNLKIFLIISVLSYLLFYKLTSYLADFKINENISRLDIVFLSIFAIVLFLPVSNIDTSDVSLDENRTLAKYKPLFDENKNINLHFGSDFESWISDRFAFRHLLISLNWIPKILDKYWETPKVLKGYDDWIFYKSENSIRNYQNLDLFNDNDLKLAADYLSSVNRYCKKNNKKFYFILCLDKNKIYGDKFPNKVTKSIPDTESRAAQLVKYLRKNTDIKVIYPYDSLMKRKSEGLYYKSDTHWNELGGYIGYEDFYKVFSKDYKDVPKTQAVISETVNYAPKGDLNRMLPKGLKIKNDENKTLKVKNQTATCTKFDNNRGNLICKNSDKKAKYNLIVYRDSFAAALIPYLSENFKYSKFVKAYDIKAIELKNSDVVILEMTERNLTALPELKFTED